MMNGLRETTFAVNSSYSSLNKSLNSTLEALMNRMEKVEKRLTKIEENPKEVLIDQIDAIHREVSPFVQGPKFMV